MLHIYMYINIKKQQVVLGYWLGHSVYPMIDIRQGTHYNTMCYSYQIAENPENDKKITLTEKKT